MQTNTQRHKRQTDGQKEAADKQQTKHTKHTTDHRAHRQVMCSLIIQGVDNSSCLELSPLPLHHQSSATTTTTTTTMNDEDDNAIPDNTRSRTNATTNAMTTQHAQHNTYNTTRTHGMRAPRARQAPKARTVGIDCCVTTPNNTTQHNTTLHYTAQHYTTQQLRLVVFKVVFCFVVDEPCGSLSMVSASVSALGG